MASTIQRAAMGLSQTLGPRRRKTISETAFLRFAGEQLSKNPLSCLLDSAGPIMARARKSRLSGALQGLFTQNEGGLEYRDFDRGQSIFLDFETFALWLEEFHQRDLGPEGPTLFPLLTYEAFNPYGRSAKAHPLWRGPQALWLLTKHTFVYDRGSECLSWREPSDNRAGEYFSDVFSTGHTGPHLLGWRETERDYYDKIDLLKRDIYEGDFYQANLSQRFVGTTQQDPLQVYDRLRRLNPSPFMGIFRYGDQWILSGSPERLVAKRGTRLNARPIAGTQPRFSDPERDAASRKTLLTSPKERAEHLMLLDLIRNDLGKVARAGTVRVTEFCTLETYSHVHHLVSQVEAQSADRGGILELLRAVFPGGTITGAPKIACIKRLAQLEGEARGPYTGAIGYVDSQGNLDLNILIRTLIQVNSRVCLHAGGGIVADSLSHAEYRETRYKCAALMEALAIEGQ